nr:SLC13 family permease [Algimonas porphyrae]
MNLSDTRPRLAISLLLSGAFIESAFLNNTPIVIVLIPVIAAIAAELGIARKRLLITLSYIAILGGTMTLIGTSSNHIVVGVPRDLGLEGFCIFEISAVGLVAGLVGISDLGLFGRFALPHDDDLTFSGDQQANELITRITFRDGADFLGTSIFCPISPVFSKE